MEDTSPTSIQYLLAVFGSGETFGLTLSRFICVSIVVNIVVVLIKYSNSVKMLSVCLFFNACAM